MLPTEGAVILDRLANAVVHRPAITDGVTIGRL
jgi:hypothetical protein